MATQYGGKSGNITQATLLTITGVTSSTSPTITVSGALPATFQPGNAIDIIGVVGVPALNGQWIVNTLPGGTGGSTFTVVGSPTAGTWTSGGTVNSLDLGTFSTPNDGDAMTASSVNVALDALADRTAFLALATGAYKVVGVIQAGLSLNHLVNTTATGVPSDITPVAGFYAHITGANLTDIFIGQFNGTIDNLTSGMGNVEISMYAALFAPPTTNFFAGPAPLATPLNGPSVALSSNTVGGANLAPVSCSIFGSVGSLTGGGTNAGTLSLGVAVYQSGTPSSFNFIGDWNIIGLLLRNTGLQNQ